VHHFLNKRENIGSEVPEGYSTLYFLDTEDFVKQPTKYDGNIEVTKKFKCDIDVNNKIKWRNQKQTYGTKWRIAL
jgi:hypothetical protein